MSDDADKIAEGIEKWFGIPTAWIAIPAIIVATVTLELHVQSKLSDPLFRWLALGTLCLLCLGGVAFERRPRKIGYGQKETRGRAPHFLHFMCGFAVAATILSVDLYLHMGSYKVPLEMSTPTILRELVVTVDNNGRKTLDTMNVQAIASAGVMSQIPQPDGIGFDFIIRKKDAYQELVLNDVVVTVDRFEPFPPYRMGPAGAVTVDKIILVVELKKETGALPWTFHPSMYWTKVGGLAKWESGCLALRDAYQQPMRVILASKDGGIFKLNAKLIVSEGPAHRKTEIDILPESVGFAYIPIGDGTTPATDQGNGKPYDAIDDLKKYKPPSLPFGTAPFGPIHSGPMPSVPPAPPPDEEPAPKAKR
jgi:hypothetical protein